MSNGISPEQAAQMNASARPVEFEVIGGKDPEVRIRIEDEGREAIVRVKVVIASINRVGNDPNNGLPSYQVNTQVVLGLLKSESGPKESLGVQAGRTSVQGICLIVELLQTRAPIPAKSPPFQVSYPSGGVRYSRGLLTVGKSST